MKRLLIILTLLVSYAASAQVPNNVPWYQFKNKLSAGHFYADSTLAAPLLDTTHQPKQVGVIVYRQADSSFYGAVSLTGKRWQRIGTGAMAGGTASWGNITGTITTQSDLMALLNGKQATLPTGTASQYFRGNLTLGSLSTDVQAITNPLYSALGHVHTAAQVTDFASAGRALFSAGDYISVSPLGVISYTGPIGGTQLKFSSFFTLYGDSVAVNAVPSSIITGTKTSAYISDFTAQVQAVGDARYPKLADSTVKYVTPYQLSQNHYNRTQSDARYIVDADYSPDSTGFDLKFGDGKYIRIKPGGSDDSAFVRMAPINDSTVRFTRRNGSFVDLVRPCDTNGGGSNAQIKRQQWKNSTATTYTLTSTANGNFSAVYLNGLELDSADYTVSGTTLTLLFTPTTTDRISIHYTY